MRSYPVVDWTWPNKQEVAAALRAAIAVADADYPWLCNALCEIDPDYEPNNHNQFISHLSEFTQTMVADINYALNRHKPDRRSRTTLWAWMYDQTPPRILYGPAGLELGWRQEWVAELLADLAKPKDLT